MAFKREIAAAIAIPIVLAILFFAPTVVFDALVGAIALLYLPGFMRVTSWPSNTTRPPSAYNTYCVTAPNDPRLPNGGTYQVCGLADVTLAKFGQTAALSAWVNGIPAPPAPEPLVEADLDMAVGRLNAPVLIGHARIIAGRLHAVMPAQVIVALGEIELCVAVEILESGRQRVGPMLAWDASELPKRILQPLGDG